MCSIGFVTFCTVEAAEKALLAPPEHLILDGRFVSDTKYVIGLRKTCTEH